MSPPSYLKRSPSYHYEWPEPHQIWAQPHTRMRATSSRHEGSLIKMPFPHQNDGFWGTYETDLILKWGFSSSHMMGFSSQMSFFFQSSPIRSEVKKILPSLPTWRWELTECLKQKENSVRRLRDVCIVFDMFLFTFHNICLWPLKWFLHVPARRWSYPIFVRTTTFTHRYGCRHAYETWI